jgi:hypothetical protein
MPSEDPGLKRPTQEPRRLAGPSALLVAVAAAATLVAGCSGKNPVPPGARYQGDDLGPAYFTQSTDYGYRYAHNWVGRPCFTIDLPGSDWVLQAATADYVLWHKGEYRLKVYLSDNREKAFAVAGMRGEDALRAYIGYEIDYIKPKFEKSISPAPSLRTNTTGLWALWRWEGRMGRRGGVGKAPPADQRHLIASLWLDPWVLSFDWATAKTELPDYDSPELLAAVQSLHFEPKCFAQMRSGETWTQPEGGGSQLGSDRLTPALNPGDERQPHGGSF